MIAIKTEHLSKYYGKLAALQDLNLEIPANSVFGFLGPNGAGKSTTVKLLTGFARPSGGKAWVAGEAVDNSNSALRRRTGFLPDVPAFYDWMSGQEFMHYCGQLFGMKPHETRRRSSELLELVGITKSAARRIGGYSRGMRQRLAIAQALINSPSVLFMDEPASALDPIGRREILDLIARLKESTTVFMSSHILADIERVCDMVGIINQGRLVTVSSVTDLRNRYARSVFEMEFMEDAAAFVSSLQNIPWLAHAETTIDRGRPLTRATALDLDRARHELPLLIGQSGLTLIRYELVMPELEDIFLKIIDEVKVNE